jgi:hypothetical protein
VLWENIAEICDKQLGADFESVAKCWLSDKKFRALNVCISTIFSSIWKLRNDMCFQGVGWQRMEVLLRKGARMMQDWRVLSNPQDAEKLETRRCRKARNLGAGNGEEQDCH